MKITAVIALLAAVAPSLIQARDDICFTPYTSGVCIPTAQCDGYGNGGWSVPGYCPGGADIQCCVNIWCATSRGLNGVCKNASKDCRTGYLTGYCPGGNDIQCCQPPIPPGLPGSDPQPTPPPMPTIDPDPCDTPEGCPERRRKARAF